MKNLFLLLVISVSLSLYGSDFDQNCKLARSNDTAKLKPLLMDTKTINSTDEYGKTLLFCAVDYGAYKSASLLLEKGIDPNAKDDQNRTALQHLLEYRTGEHFDDLKTAMLLLDHGASVEQVDKYGNSLLMQASNPKMIRLLLSYGADMNQMNSEGDNALFRFAKDHYNQKAEIIKALSDFGIDLSQKDQKGKTAVDYMTPKDQSALYAIMGGGKIKFDNKKIENELIDAVRASKYKLVEHLLDAGEYANTKDTYYKKPIIFAKIDDARMTKLFLDHGADMNSTYWRGYTRVSLLQGAIAKCADESVSLLLERQKKRGDEYAIWASLLRCEDANRTIKIANLLLNKGFSVSVSDKKGHTPLHLSAREGRGELCQFFVAQRIDMNLKDKEGVVPLFYALAANNDSCVRVLLELGADIHTKGPKGVDALQVAISENHTELVKQLLGKGLDTNETDKEGHTALMMAAREGNFDITKGLLEKGADSAMVDADGASALHHACRYKGSVDVVKLLLEQGLDINLETKKGQTPLLVAANNDNLLLPKYLIEHGANINAQDGEGNTPLHRAAKKGHKKMIAFLLLKGANKELKNKEGLTAQELAVKEHSYSKENYQKIFSGKYDGLILDKKHIFSFKDVNDIILYAANGGDLNVKNENDDSLLHIASKQCCKEKTVKYLLTHGLDVNAKNKSGKTPLHLAAQHHQGKNVHNLLQHGVTLDVKDNQGKMPIDLAIEDISSSEKDLLMILRAMFRHGLKSIPSVNSKGYPILNDVLKNPELTAFLIDHGLDVNIMSENGHTPLITCAMLDYGLSDYSKSVKVLLEYNADLNISKDGETALYTAVRHGSNRVAELLLKQGADIQVKTKNGDTPLLYAVRNGKPKMLSLLLKYHADPNIANKEGNSALLMAVRQMNEEMVKMLVEHKADANKTDDMGWTPLEYAKKLKLEKIIAILEPITTVKNNLLPRKSVKKDQKKSDDNITTVKAKDKNIGKYKQSKLHKAVASQNMDEVKNLLDNHAEIDVVDILGRTPLHYAAIRGYVGIAKVLLHRGANINAVDSSKQWTPLFYATFMGHDKMIDLLKGKGADTTIKDKFGKTADDYKTRQ